MKTGKWLIVLGIVAVLLVLAEYGYTKFKNKSAFSPSDYLEFGGAAAIAAGVVMTHAWKGGK